MDLLIIGAALERQSYRPIVSPKLKTYADLSRIRGSVISKANPPGLISTSTIRFMTYSVSSEETYSVSS